MSFEIVSIRSCVLPSGKRNYLPSAPLLFGFALLFKVNHCPIDLHLNLVMYVDHVRLVRRK
jgi:hypothetical protein